MKKLLDEIKMLYKINIYNMIGIILISLFSILVISMLESFFRMILNIHLGFVLKIDFLSIYSALLSLILPVAILIIERIEAKNNAIVSEAYLKYTWIFPGIFYFVLNLAILAFYKNQYYFIFMFIVSTIIIIRMYYISLKMISDLLYERTKINRVRENTISDDLLSQAGHFSNSNVISNYKKYGVVVGKYDYISTTIYDKKSVYSNKEYRIVNQYNYKVLNKVVKRLKKINNDYVKSIELKNGRHTLNNEQNPNIIVSLLHIGATINKYVSWITIYYAKGYEEEAGEILKLLNNRVYITSEVNNHLYIDMAYKEIQNECVQSINSMSATLLTNSLNKYLDIYKNYINEISNKYGEYTYDSSYSQVSSIIKIEAYDFLNNIQKNIYDYADMITQYNNSRLMNSLISFLYEIILYSYNKKELLSIQYLYGTYIELNNCTLKLEEDISYKKIKMEIFEFINLLKYNYNDVDKDFIHDVLLICCRILSRIIFDLSLKDMEKFYEYYSKYMKLIDEMEEELNHYIIKQDEKNNNDNFNNIRLNYFCNIFAITAYVVHNIESSNGDVSKIISFFRNFDSKEITDILISTIIMEYNGNPYSWELMEHTLNGNEDGVYNVNTVDYLIHLYCILITNINVKSIELDSNYELSVYVTNIINELKKLGKKEYISAFENVVREVINDEKEYIRNTPISEVKVNQFKRRFYESYYKYNRVRILFEKTKNLRIVQRRKRGVNNLGIRNIVDKTYFLEKTPNNRCIIWSNFEDGYANSFINSEEQKISKSINKKAEYKNCSLMKYLHSLSKYQLKKSIIFSNYDTVYNTIGYSDIEYNNKNDENNYANMFIVINREYIPVVIIDGLDEKYVFHAFNNSIGKFENYKEQFKIEISDYYNNDKLLNKSLEEKIEGLELDGEDKRNHLLESVNLMIGEYVIYDDSKLIVSKFDH